MAAASKEVNSVSQVQLQRGAQRASLPCSSVASLLERSSLRGDPVGRERGDDFSAGWERSPKGHLPAADKTAVQGG